MTEHYVPNFAHKILIVPNFAHDVPNFAHASKSCQNGFFLPDNVAISNQNSLNKGKECAVRYFK